MKLPFFILSIVLTFGSHVFSQSNIDSLSNKLRIAATDSAKGKLNLEIAEFYAETNAKKAKEYARNAIRYYQKDRDTLGEAKALRQLGYSQLNSGENIESINTQKKAIQLFEGLALHEESLKCYSGISYAYNKQGDIDKALETTLKGLRIIRDKKLSSKLLAKHLTDLGRIYRKNRQFDKAIETYTRAIEIAKKNKDFETSSVLLMNLGNVYHQNMKTDTAITFFKQSIAESRKCNCTSQKVKVWTNLGYAYYLNEDINGMNTAADSAQAYFQDTTNLQAYGDILTLKGLAHQLNGEHELAIPYLERAIDLAKKNSSKEKLLQILTTTQWSYVSTGNQEKLTQTLIDVFALKDQSQSTEMANAMAEMEIQYNVEQQEAELAQAEQENKLKETYIADVKRRNMWLGLSLVLSVLLAGFAFYQLNKNKKSSQIISKNNEELARLLKQKNLLLKEIHHRVKNNLQTVSSLLSLQTHGSKNNEIKKAIGIGQSRLKSISLLHQKLYQHDELTKIEMDGYIDDLCTYIVKNFNYEDKNIEVRTNANGIALDLDTAIPIGLILNELVTNSIKHAFTDLENAELEVSIKPQIEPNKFELRVKNNGRGLTADIDIQKLSSTGLKLVSSLSRQLKGSFNSYQDEKAHFIVNFEETIE